MPSLEALAELRVLWEKALAEPIGLCIKTDDRVLLRQHLYNCRAEMDREELRALSVSLSPKVDDEIWIVKRDAPVR